MVAETRRVDASVGRATAAAPHVSAVVPAFNGAAVITRALESLAAQHFTDIDWVVIDDASQDATAEMVREFLEDYPGKGKLVRHSENWGLSRSLNHGLRESAGELVLIVHQDIVLGSADWVARAVADLERDPSVAVVTGNYGIPVIAEVDFAQRVFGVLRRQFHQGPAGGSEYATFTEFKCDLIRRRSLEAVGGFPERFRIAGEDLWVSYSLQERGERIFKDFSLRSVQRFTGDATTVGGNLRKEFLFAKVLSGTLLRFRSRVARGLARTPYSRSRSWNRASQPVVALAGLVLLLAALLTGVWWIWAALGAVVVGRLGYYSVRLYPVLRSILGHVGRALAESLAGSFLGLVSDVVYSAGLFTGLLRWRQRGTV